MRDHAFRRRMRLRRQSREGTCDAIVVEDAIPVTFLEAAAIDSFHAVIDGVDTNLVWPKTEYWAIFLV